MASQKLFLSSILLLTLQFLAIAVHSNPTAIFRENQINRYRAANESEFFKNPILDPIPSEWDLHPTFYFHTNDGLYYYAISTGSAIHVLRSDQMTNWENSISEMVTVFNMTEPLTGILNPQIRQIGGNWFIYFSAMTTSEGISFRNYVVKSREPQNPLGPYEDPVRLTFPDDEDAMALHGTVFEYEGNGGLYFLWAGRVIDEIYGLNIYIAPLSSPTQVTGPRVLLRAPERPWENFGTPIVEAPQVLHRNRWTFVAFSASRYDNPDYCLGLIGIDGGKDPLILENWWQGIDGCVMSRNDEQQVFAIGHAAFTTSPDGTESWILYTAADNLVDGVASGKSIRAERFHWDSATGVPIFPRPAGLEVELQIPSGQNDMKFLHD